MALDKREVPTPDLRPKLVALGVSMGVQRYVGQDPTEAAHEFADKALVVLEAILGRRD